MPSQKSGVYRTLLALAVPIMLNNLLQMLYNLVDAYFLGRISAAALSAPTISFTLIFFIVVFGLGFSMAGTTLIAQSKGKGDLERANFYAGQTTSMIMAMSVILSVLGLVFTPALLRVMQVPADAFEYTRQYMTIIFAGMPLMFITFVHRAVLQGVGDSVTPLIVQIITILLNVVLDPILIFGLGPIPALEVAGAAYATVISRGVGAVVAAIMLVRGARGIRLRREHLRPDWAAWKRITDIGLPNAIGQAVPAFGFTVLQGVVNSLGTAVIAAFGVGNRIVSLFNMPAIGFAQATTSVVGQQLGAKRKDLAVVAVRQSVLTVGVFITVGMTLTFLFGGGFIRFFVDDAEVIRYGAELFRILSPSVILYTLFTVITGAFQGGGDTRPVMVLNVARLWGIRVPLAYVLAIVLAWGPAGIWWAMFASNLVIAAIGFVWLAKGHWLHKIDPDTI
ncbi:MAG: MATE family efflux transporter [Spirochaetaceae bacterium]|nr:MAG: MATE family efflux transporter [Spirochaetaceae bacterium]